MQNVYTKEQHLDLAALVELVAFELIFDLLIPLLPLLVLGAHATTHSAGVLTVSGRACNGGNGNGPMRPQKLSANECHGVEAR